MRALQAQLAVQEQAAVMPVVSLQAAAQRRYEEEQTAGSSHQAAGSSCAGCHGLHKRRQQGCNRQGICSRLCCRLEQRAQLQQLAVQSVP